MVELQAPGKMKTLAIVTTDGSPERPIERAEGNGIHTGAEAIAEAKFQMS